MKFTDRKDFLYDAELFRRADTKTALAIYAEWVLKYSPVPNPSVLEVDRSTAHIDPVWHVPLEARTPISRTLPLPMIVRSSRNKWVIESMTKYVSPKRTNQITFAHNHLEKFDYFPQRGDMIVYSGYRNIIVEVEVPLETFWHQTNVWLGLICHTEVAIEGDVRPLLDPSKVAGPEVSQSPGSLSQVKSAE